MRSTELAGDVASMLFGCRREDMRSVSSRREHWGREEERESQMITGSVVGTKVPDRSNRPCGSPVDPS